MSAEFLLHFYLGPFLLCFYSCIHSTFLLQSSMKISSISSHSTSKSCSSIKSSPSILNSFITSPQSFIITINFNTWCTQLIISWKAGIIIILNNCKCERVVGWGARLQHHLLVTVWLSPPWLKVYSL